MKKSGPEGSAASSRPGVHLVFKGLAFQTIATHPTSSHAETATELGLWERGEEP